MLLRSRVFALLLAGLTLPLAGHAWQKAATMAAQTPSVSVPDFKGKTLEEVRALDIIPNSKLRLFATITPQGPTDGVVASQTPLAGTRVYPGRSALLITLEPRKPSALENFLQQVITAQNAMTQVPQLDGDTAVIARRKIVAARLRANIVGSEGYVVQQSPLPGVSVKPGTTVTATLALPQTTVPSLYGATMPQAQAAVARAYLTLQDSPGSDAAGATVQSQSLQPGTQVPRGSPISIRLYAPVPAPAEPQPASGVPPQPVPAPQTPTPETPPPPQIFVPSVIKLTYAQATDVLASVKLQPTKLSGPDSGLVTLQSPIAGTPVEAGATVGLTLALPSVIVPPLLQESESVATERLRVFSLVPRSTRSPDWRPDATHLVIAQDPSAGATVDAGSTVAFTVGNTAPPPPWWTKLPTWTWLTAALALAGALGFFLRRPPAITHETSPLSPLATCTLAAQQPTPHIRVDNEDGPALRFKLELRDRTSAGHSTVADEPTLTRKG